MKRIKIVQIGIEHDHAAMTFESLKKQSDIFELVGWCDPEREVYADREGMRTIAGYHVAEGEYTWSPDAYRGYPCLTLEEALSIPGLDAAAIETSETNLTYFAQLAADRGLHVHMDKPGGYDEAAYEKLLDTFRRTGRQFHAGYMYRYNPEVIHLLREIEEGKYGRITSVECHMDCMHPSLKRDWLKKYKGGMMYFLGCHLIDLIFRILGEPKEVLPMNLCSGFEGAEGEDIGFAVLKYDRAIAFAKTSAVEPGGFMRRQLVVTGEKGAKVLEPIEAYTPRGGSELYTGVRVVDSDIYNWGNDGTRYSSEPFDRYDGMMAAFASYIRGDSINPYTLDYEMSMYRVMLKACGIQSGVTES